MRPYFVAASLTALLAVPACAGHAVHPQHVIRAMAVPLDEVRVVSFAKPVSTLYVGNPVIADVTIIDNRHAFVQGKAFGATNIVALDGNGRPIANQQIVVSAKDGSVVTLQRGTQQTTYACAGKHCQSTPQPGDGKDAFEAGTDQVQKYQGMLSKAAAGSP